MQIRKTQACAVDIENSSNRLIDLSSEKSAWRKHLRATQYICPSTDTPLKAMDESLLNDELLLILKRGRQNEITFLNAQIANIPCPRVIVTELTARDCLEAARPPNWTKVRLEQEIVKIMSETGRLSLCLKHSITMM